MAKKIITRNLIEPLHGVTAVRIDINTIDGNLEIDPHTSGQELVSGALQYLESQDPPACTVDISKNPATLALNSSSKSQPWIRFPWSACNGATLWQIHLTPSVSTDIHAHSGGGNIRLDLTGMMVTHVTADTGGGNIEVVLPAGTAGLDMTVKTGAGDVTIHKPNNTAARVHAASGLGKVIMDAQLIHVDEKTYQSPDYESASRKIEITATSGAGNVVIRETDI